jgi:hypothetical protein
VAIPGRFPLACLRGQSSKASSAACGRGASTRPSQSAGRRADCGFAEVEDTAAPDDGGEVEEATDELIAVIFGNLRGLRRNSGLGLQQLAEASETNH